MLGAIQPQLTSLTVPSTATSTTCCSLGVLTVTFIVVDPVVESLAGESAILLSGHAVFLPVIVSYPQPPCDVVSSRVSKIQNYTKPITHFSSNASKTVKSPFLHLFN